MAITQLSKNNNVIHCQMHTWSHIFSEQVKSPCTSLAHYLFLPVNIKLKIYYALFSSLLNYCHLVWGTTTKTNLNSILLLQKKILRFIADVPYNYHTESLFHKYKVIRVEHFNEYRLLHSIRFSSSTFMNFLYCTSELTLHESTMNTRFPEKWLVPRNRTNYNLQSLHYNIPTFLNKWHLHSSNAFTLPKNKLRTYFA